MNGSHSDNMAALVNDAVAYGIGAVIGVCVQTVFCCVGLDMINYSALKQVDLAD